MAGNITGIENAKIAIMQGRLAASQILDDAAAAEEYLKKINDERQNAKVRFHPDLVNGKEKLQSSWMDFSHSLN